MFALGSQGDCTTQLVIQPCPDPGDTGIKWMNVAEFKLFIGVIIFDKKSTG